MKIVGYVILFFSANYLAIRLGTAKGKGKMELIKSELLNILFFVFGIVVGILWFL